MADARVIARGAVWNYSAQIATVLAQVAYAAVTSRLLAPHDFGVFAAALTSVALINLIALAGLPQVVGRMTDLEPGRMVGLLLYAALVGVAAAGVAVLSAPLWALAWGVPASVPVIRLLAVTSFLTPLVALGNGIALRTGLFRRLAGATVVANVGGMALGAVAVLLVRTAESLALAQIFSQVAVAAMVLTLCRHYFRGRPDLRATLADMRYSSKAIVSGLISYTATSLGKVTVTHAIGTVPLGNWNRAEAITTNPFWLLGQAIIQAVFPEFRHDVADRTRTRRVWSDLLGMVGWVTVPLGVTLSVLSPVVVHVLLGDGWALAAGYASALALIGGMQPVVFLLINAFEALGRFRWSWAGYIVSLVVNVAAAIVALVLRDVWPVFIGMFVAFAIMHPMHLLLARREGLVDLRRVARHYAEIAGFSLLLAVPLFTAVHVDLVIGVSPLLLAAVVALVAGGIVVMVRQREHLPPVRLARAYGLLPDRAPAADSSAVPADR